MAGTDKRLVFGASGGLVSELQEALNKKGYNLDVNGNFDTHTLDAVKNYQRKNGLAVNGIVADRFWDALINGADLAKLDTTSFNDTTSGKGLYNAYSKAQTALADYGDPTKNTTLESMNDLISKINRREKFSFDLNGDALYQQYKDRYTQQAEMAREDAIGQASAMTGGYGNSYAQSVGQQMYQKEMQGLNDVIPELYQLAYDKYNTEGQELYNQYSLYSDAYNREYDRLSDQVNIAKNDYYDAADMYYNDLANKNAAVQWDEGIRQYNEGLNYTKDRDKVEDKRWEKEYNSEGGALGVDDELKAIAATLKTEADWQGYFEAVREKDGMKAAQQEMAILSNAGLIPNEMKAAAHFGATGSKFGTTH